MLYFDRGYTMLLNVVFLDFTVYVTQSDKKGTYSLSNYTALCACDLIKVKDICLKILHKICDRNCEKGSYSLSNCMHLTIHCEACEYGTNLKFGHLTLLTWFYSWEQFYINGLNTPWIATNWSWKLRKAIRPLFADPVTFYYGDVVLCVNITAKDHSVRKLWALKVRKVERL